MALVVRALFHWLGGSRANANRLPPASSRLSATARCRSRHLRKKALRRSSISALKLPTALGNHDATLQENGAELVDQGTAPGVYTVVRALPSGADGLQYQVQSDREPYGRIAPEHQLLSVAPPSDTRPAQGALEDYDRALQPVSSCQISHDLRLSCTIAPNSGVGRTGKRP